MEKLLSVYLTNLGKYNEGYLIGEWVDLPIDAEELEEVFKRIGINEEYEEYFITDYESDCGISVDEYENIYTLNEKLEELENEDTEKIKAMFESGNFSNIQEIIDNLDYYDFYEGITAEEFEEQLVNDCYDLSTITNSWLDSYITIDYEQMARDDDTIMETTNGVLWRR